VQDAVASVFAGFGVGADLRKKINVKFNATFKEKKSIHILIVNETKIRGSQLLADYTSFLQNKAAYAKHKTIFDKIPNFFL